MMGDLRASIDIGSNSVLLLVGKASEKIEIIYQESNVTGLGRGLDTTGVFCQEAMDESLEVLTRYAQTVKELGVDPSKVIATATEASRVAKNAKEYFALAKEKTGIDVTIITSEAEAYYSTRGILLGENFGAKPVFIMDIGGASTELIKVNPDTYEIYSSISMPFGAVRITNWLADGIFDDKISACLSQFKNELNTFKTAFLYCVAGTMTSVSNMILDHKEFVEKEVHGHEFSTSKVIDLMEKYKNYSAEQFLERYPFLGKRSSTIYGGMLVATTVFNQLGVKDVHISTQGLRYGTLSEGFIKEEYKYGL